MILLVVLLPMIPARPQTRCPLANIFTWHPMNALAVVGHQHAAIDINTDILRWILTGVSDNDYITSVPTSIPYTHKSSVYQRISDATANLRNGGVCARFCGVSAIFLGEHIAFKHDDQCFPYQRAAVGATPFERLFDNVFSPMVQADIIIPGRHDHGSP